VLGFQRVDEGGDWRHLGQWLDDSWRPARVEGSDGKSLADVGRPHVEGGAEQRCWLKIGDFSYAAVRLALQMHEQRVASAPPRPLGTRLVNARFTGGLLDGKTLALSPDLNNFIGIRGSGKSSALECLRYALDYRLRAETEDSTYKDGLVARTLGSGGKVTLEVITGEGHRYRIERVYGEGPRVYRDTELVPGLRPEGVVKSRYFGQKDLAKFSEQRFAREMIERFTSTGQAEGQRAQTLAHQIEQKLVRLAQDQQRLVAVADTEAKLAEVRETLRKFDDNVREKLAAQVVLERDAAVARDLLAHEQASVAALQRWLDEYAAAAERLAKMPLATVNGPTAAIAAEFGAFCKEYEAARSLLQRLQARVVAMRAQCDALAQHQEASREAFAEIRRALQLLGQLNADSFVQLTKQKNLLEATLAEIDNLKEKSSELRGRLDADLAALQQVWHASYQQVAAAVAQLNRDSPGLTIRLVFKGDKAAFVERLVGMVSGLQRKTIEKVASLFADGIELHTDLRAGAPRLTAEAGLKPDQIAKLEENLRPALRDLLTWRVPDAVSIEFQGKALHEHSIGQRATALMLFLLSRREFDVLIVDQPEDDLDNQTLYTEIIRRLLALKGQRQMVFATHNPNIPVLGDADQLFRCQYRPDRIDIESGSIDRPAMQAAIVSVMEGGEEALRRRNQIYSIWMH
jgi:predicted ATPase